MRLLPADEPAFSISRTPGFGYPIVAGMNVAFKCEIDANPASRAKWIKDGDVNQSKAARRGHRPANSGTATDGLLNLTSVTLEDSGWYR